MALCAFVPLIPLGKWKPCPVFGRTRCPNACLSQAGQPSFEKFLSNVGVEFHNAALSTSERCTRGIRATTGIEPNSLLVRVPRSAALTAKITGTDERREATAKFGWWLPLVVTLLEERAKGSGSIWYEYIRALPAEPPGAVWACETLGLFHVAEQLRPYGMAGYTRRHMQFLKEAFNWARPLLPGVCNWRDFVWAVGVVHSRAFRIDTLERSFATSESSSRVGRRFEKAEDSYGTFALLPGIDMLNHSALCRTDFKYNPELDSFDIFGGVGFEEGSEVFVSYGAKTSDDLLFFYGFVEGNNVADNILVRSNTILRRAIATEYAHGVTLSRRQEREILLRDSNLVQDGVFYKVRRDYIDDEIMAILRICFATEEELAQLDSVQLSSKKGRKTPISLANEIRVWRCIASECDRLLNKLPVITSHAATEAAHLRQNTVCSAAWDWHQVGKGSTLAEALYVAEKFEIYNSTKERVLHFARVSEAIGRVTTVLLPPSQSILSTETFRGMSLEDSKSGLPYFTI